MSKITANTRLKQKPQNLDPIFIREQRRGTQVPEKPEFIKKIFEDYPVENRKGGDGVKVPHWLEKFQRKCPITVREQIPNIAVKIGDAYSSIHSLSFSPNGEVIVLGTKRGEIEVRNAMTGERQVKIKDAGEFPITKIRFHKGFVDRFFAVGICGNIYNCYIVGNMCDLFAREKRNEINTCDLDASSTTLATAGKDATIRLYDVNIAKLKQKFRKSDAGDGISTPFHRMRIFALKYHPMDENLLASGGWDCSVKVWDVRCKGGCSFNIKGPYICGDAIDIRDNLLLTGSCFASCSLQLWDIRNGHLVDTLVPLNKARSIDGEFLYCARFFESRQGSDLVVCGGGGSTVVEVINYKTSRQTCYYNVHKAIRALDVYYGRVAFGGLENVLRIAYSQGITGAREENTLGKDSLYQFY